VHGRSSTGVHALESAHLWTLAHLCKTLSVVQLEENSCVANLAAPLSPNLAHVVFSQLDADLR